MPVQEENTFVSLSERWRIKR